MSGHTKWSDITTRRQRGPAYGTASVEFSHAIDVAQTLGELRKERGRTQVSLARTMGKDQGTISRTEHQDDLFVSTLREYVEALGGRLELRAVFDDQVVEILASHEAVPA